MLLTFLGTGAGDFWGMHGAECDGENCARARELGGRNIRRAPSLLISPDILVDFHDSDVQMQRLGIGVDSVHHLCITHGHYDHFMPGRIHDFAAALPHTLRLYGNTAVRDGLAFAERYEWDGVIGNFRERSGESDLQVQVVTPGTSFTVGDTTVTPVTANHMIEKEYLIQSQQALNYVFQRDGRTVFYGLDSSYLLPEAMALFRSRGFRFDVAVLDATFGYMDIDPFGSGHHNFAMVEQTVEELRQADILTEKAVIVGSHIYCHGVPPHDDTAPELARRGIVLAHDGMTLEV